MRHPTLENFLAVYVIYLCRSSLGDSLSLCLRGLRDTTSAREALVRYFGYAPRVDWGQVQSAKLTKRGFLIVARNLDGKETACTTWNPIEARLNEVASPDRNQLWGMLTLQLIVLVSLSLAINSTLPSVRALTTTPQAALEPAIYVALGTCWFMELRLLYASWLAYATIKYSDRFARSLD